MSRRTQIESLLESDPHDVFLMYAMANELANEGDAAATIAAFDRVLSEHPDYVPAYFRKGQFLAAEGDAESARAIVTRGIDVAERVGDDHAAGEMTAFLEML